MSTDINKQFDSWYYCKCRIKPGGINEVSVSVLSDPTQPETDLCVLSLFVSGCTLTHFQPSKVEDGRVPGRVLQLNPGYLPSHEN